MDKSIVSPAVVIVCRFYEEKKYAFFLFSSMVFSIQSFVVCWSLFSLSCSPYFTNFKFILFYSITLVVVADRQRKYAWNLAYTNK